MIHLRYSILVLILLAGCGEAKTSPPKQAKPASQPATSQDQAAGSASQPALSKDDQVRLVVFRMLLESYERLYPKPEPSRLNAFYLAVGMPEDKRTPNEGLVAFHDYEDPSAALMAAIGARKIPIKKHSQCKTDTGCCLDKATGEPGYMLRVGPVKWLDANTATLEAGHWEHLLGASGEDLKVQRKGDGWEITYTGRRWVS
jgi:hypothetical protein